MVELVARTPCAGLLPLRVGAVLLDEVAPGALTSVSPYKGQAEALSKVLQAAHGMGFPAPSRATGDRQARAIWFGHGQAMLVGPAPDPALADHAALTDQSDAWAAVRLHGPGAEDVLARLVPVDLRAGSFPEGHSMRSLLFHMTASITRIEDGAFLILAFRSMAATLVHDLQTAMEAVAARG
ncbi:sarcosine oxidase subunit gamma [Cribrihabitans marinus]|uniref:Sarcosine oxidase subunit gamma n=1 Tax=Cribrihabitans marinus TaxID=1227549 RepID=A0A1H6RKB6_9RHOB|nr:sarcosine oxidase subunit gamma [Cribrihabitans marinus]GGH20607.1 hypothetical protein GCM10010973_04670 [Cribrihabitans marinus]SEI51632.1 sarcosine oxidase subunit gamma [Cribrihabitans marinus]